MTPEIDRVVETLIRIGTPHGKTAAQVAIAWILSHPEVSTVINGPDTPEEVEENVGGTGWSLPGDELALLDRRTQLEDAPHRQQRHPEEARARAWRLRAAVDITAPVRP